MEDLSMLDITQSIIPGLKGFNRTCINVTKSDLPDLKEYNRYLEKIWENGWLTNDGELLRSLEDHLMEYLKVKNFIAVSNGTSAIQMSLESLKVKGDVITTPFTFAATTNALMLEGLNPIFADIDPETFNIDPDDVERKITDDTSAILAVHVYGNPCAVDELQEIADDHDLKLIYDAAHSFAVEYHGKSLLDYGDVSILSFHATKIFHTIEGGGIKANSEELIEILKLLRNHGIRSEEEVILPGSNAKMNEFQAAMGLCNLKTVEEKINLRKERYQHYKNNLRGVDGVTFQKLVASRYNYAYIPVCFENIKIRDEVFSELVKEGINARKYFYPLTVNFDYFKRGSMDLIEKYDLKTAFDVSNRVLCLPLYPDLETWIVDRITDKIISMVG